MKDHIIQFPKGKSIQKRVMETKSDTVATLEDLLKFAKQGRIDGVIISAFRLNSNNESEIVLATSDVNSLEYTQLLSALQVDSMSKTLLLEAEYIDGIFLGDDFFDEEE